MKLSTSILLLASLLISGVTTKAETLMEKRFRLASEGDIKEQWTLGLYYEEGISLEKSQIKAAWWYRKAAEQGDPSSQASLGKMYEEGRGVPQDYAEALKWYRRLAEENWPAGFIGLGRMHRNGWGVPENHPEAAKWYRKAAELGNSHAQGELGWLHAFGYKVPRDFIQAYVWLNVAAGQRAYQESQKKLAAQRDEVVRQGRMSPSQLAEAQTLSREYWEKYVMPFQ